MDASLVTLWGLQGYKAPPLILSHPESFSTCLNDAGQPLQVEVEGPGPFSYLWQRKSGTGPWEDIEGAVSQSYIPPTGQQGNLFYRVRISGPDGSTAYSNAATVVVYNPPAFGLSAPQDEVCLNTDLVVRSSIDINLWDIEWQRSEDGIQWEATGVQAPEISHPTSSTGSAQYRLVAVPKGTPNPVCTLTSPAVRVSVGDCMALSVSKEASGQNVPAGATISYTIRVTNNGPSTLQAGQAISLRENLPEGFEVLSVEAPGTLDLEAGTWTGLSLEPGQNAELVISGTISPEFTGESLQNTVTVGPPPGVRNTGGPDSLSATTTTVTRSADLNIRKTSSAPRIAAGQALSYGLIITNNGPSNIHADDVMFLQENLPEGFVVRNYNIDKGEFNHQTGSITGLELGAGESVTLRIYGEVPAGFEGTMLQNIAYLQPPSDVRDPVLPNSSAISIPITREADLVISKSGPDAAAPNEEISYTLNVENLGPSDAPGVWIRDIVPPDILVESWDALPLAGAEILSGATGNDNEVEINADMPAGSSVRVVITGVVGWDGNARIVNTAEVVPPAGILDPTLPNEGVKELSMEGDEQLLLRKTGTPRVAAGGSVRYTVQLLNNSSAPLSGIQFLDNFNHPDVLSEIRWSVTGSDAGVVISEEDGTGLPISFEADIPPRGKLTVLLTAIVAADFEGTLTNQASATAGAGSVSGEHATEVYLPAPLVLEKTGPPVAGAGEEIEYTIQVRNTGQGSSEPLVLRDQLPVGSRFIFAEGADYEETLHELTWTEEEIEPGGVRSYQVRIQLPPDGGTVSNTALAGGLSDVITTEVSPSSDLSILVQAPDTVHQGMEFGYEILVRNHGPSTARDIRVSEMLPPGVELVSPGGGTFDGQTITWTIVEMPKNGVIRFVVRVRPSSPGQTLSNMASVGSSGDDPDPANNEMENLTWVAPSANLSILKAGPLEAHAGQLITYAIVVNNLGPSPAEQVLITDRMPSGMEFVSADIPPMEAGTNPLRWLLPRLESGQSYTFTMEVRAPERAGEIRNVAEISSPVHDADPADNRAVFPTMLTPAADVEVIKSGPTAIDSAGLVVYELLVRNHGPSAAVELRIEDWLPVGLGPPVSISDGGQYDPESHSIRWPPLPAMAAGTERLLTVQANVVPSEAIYTLDNSADIFSEVDDPEFDNNYSETELTVYPPPALYFSLPVSRLCLGASPFMLSGGGVSNGIPGTETYSGPGVSEGRFDPNVLQPGRYPITYSFESPGGIVRQLTDTIEVLPAAFADAGPDLVIMEGDSVMLEGQASGLLISWSPAEGIADPTLARTRAAPERTISYVLRAENPGACSAEDRLQVRVYPRLRVPNAFSPNADGTNDTWEIRNIESYPDALVQIFNRFGERIYSSRGYFTPWDGTYNGAAVPAGTYYYVITPNRGLLEPFSGSLTIVR